MGKSSIGSWIPENIGQQGAAVKRVIQPENLGQKLDQILRGDKIIIYLALLILALRDTPGCSPFNQ